MSHACPEQKDHNLYASAFDDLADGYDAAFTDTAVGRALRKLVWSRLNEIFQPRQRVLELGCGTGEDAVQLACRGVEVIATDVSAQMIAVAQEKAHRHGCSARIEFHCIAIEDVTTLIKSRSLNGVFSNFGALNCVADLSSLAAAVSQHLIPGAPLLWVVMGRHAPWEWLWYLCRGELSKSFRRLNREGAAWRGRRILYPTPGELTAMLQPHFKVRRMSPVGCVLPPSYAAAWLNQAPRTLAVLTRLEELAQRSTVLASLSDHYMIEATHSPAAVH